MNEAAAVQTKNLTKAFLGKEVIKGCTMRVARGSIYGFLGANGAGKTTVFKLLSGLLTPTMGKAEVFGKDVETQRSAVLSETGILIETPVFYEHLSAAGNLEVHLAYMGKGDNGKIESVLSRVGLENTGDQPVSKFSLGMRQRLAIARAVVHQPRLLLLDEPMNGLDPMGIRIMRDFFIGLVKGQGMTILISSHILTEMEQVADTIGVIADGIIVKEAPLAEIKAGAPAGLESYFLALMAGTEGGQ